jgi:CDP-diacylglycerol--serine O-phosphatidyltransferase
MKEDPKKLHFFLPNMFTAINMGCGFYAIILGINGKIYEACIMICIGTIFDLFDGKVARWTGTQSLFGEQFDSLSDVITFGVAPSIIYYFHLLRPLNRAGFVIAFLFLLCGALRLARFNANIKKVSSSYFQGLPIPVAALSVVGYILLSLELNIKVANKLAFLHAPFLMFFAFLMISNLPFYSFKNSDLLAKNRIRGLLIVVLLLLSIVVYEELMLFVAACVYVLASFIWFLKNRKNFSFEILGEEDTQEEITQ